MPDPLAHLSAEDRELVETAGKLRKMLSRHRSPRCREAVRAIDDLAAEFTGDREFFHTGLHKSP